MTRADPGASAHDTSEGVSEDAPGAGPAARQDLRAGRLRALLLAVLVLGALLRLVHLGAESYWLDEGYSLSFVQPEHFGGPTGAAAASSPPPGLGLAGALQVARTIARSDIHPPLFYVLLWAWTELVGIGEGLARLLPALLGILALPLVHALARRAYGARVALGATAIAAASVLLVHYSQELRAYGLLTLLVLVSMGAFLRLLEGAGGATRALYVLASAAVLYTHYLGASFLVAQVVAVALVERRGPRAAGVWLLTWGAVGLLFAPWAPALAEQLTRGSGLWIPPPTAADVGGSLVEHGGSLMGAVLLLGAATRGAVVGLRAQRRATVVLVAWCAAGFLVPLAISALVVPVYLTRVTVPSAPALFVLAAVGVASLTPSAVRRAAVTVLGAALVVPLLGYYGGVQKDPWPEVVRIVEEHSEPGDLLVFHHRNAGMMFDLYRSREDLESALPFVSDATVDGARLAQLDARLAGHDGVWLVLAHTPSDAVRERIRDRVRRDFDLVLAERRIGVRFERYERR